MHGAFDAHARAETDVAVDPQRFALEQRRRAVREAFALSVEDVLARRSRVLFLDAALAAAAAPAVARIMARELGWSPAREAAELAAFGALAARYRPRSDTVASNPPAG